MPVTPSVSVILPTFNRAPYIAEAIASILTQTEPALELIVVDDGSNDGTGALVAGFGPAVTYLRQANGGKLAAISNGLDHARGDLVWIMDDDDIAPPDALQNLVAPFADAPAVVMSYGRMTKFWDGGPARREEPVDYAEDDRPFLIRLMENCFITGHPCVMVRRAALDAVRPFDLSIFASVDYYLHLNVAMQGSVRAVDPVVLRQRQHEGLRGPEENRYGEAERVKKWIAHDAYIMDGLLDRLPLDAFLDAPPWTNRPLTAPEHRRALIQRAVIAGRNKLWARALADLRDGLAMQRGEALDIDTLSILSRLLGSRYGIDEVTGSDQILDDLRDAACGREDRAAVLAAITRPLLSRVKSGQGIGSVARSWFRMMDLEATSLALRSSASRNVLRATQILRRT